MRRIEHGRKRTHVMQPTVLADPAEFGPPCYHFNLDTRFMQEGRRFQSTLPGSDDCYSLSRQLSYFSTFIAVNRLLWREILKYRGLFPEWSNPRCDHNTGRANLRAILQSKPETGLIALHTLNRSLVEVRVQLVPKPPAIFDKGIERKRGARLLLRRSLVGFQRKGSIRVGQIGRHPG